MGQTKPYQSIKEAVLDLVLRNKGSVDYDTVTSRVKSAFPTSKWNMTHWAWYRTQIVNGRFKNQFSDQIRNTLRSMAKQPENAVSDTRVKQIGDAILIQARTMMTSKCGADPDFRFKVNRWVYSRLQKDEKRVKLPIKKQLWDSGGRSCQQCGNKFDNIKGVEIHRKDSRLNYSVDNCSLLCRPCHETIPE